MNRIETIRNELAAGHPGTGKYSAEAKTAVSEINAKNRTKLVPISSAELLAWSAGAGRYEKLMVAFNSGTAGLVSLAHAALELIRRDGTELDLGLPDRMGMIDTFVAAGVFDAADKQSLIDLASVLISRAEELDLGFVTTGHAIEARAK